MPRVSDSHLAARREQILDAARVCFLRSGIHQASMQDVVAEAGLSIGGVYRYFPSKTELVTALAERVVTSVANVIEGAARQRPPPPLLQTLRDAFDLIYEDVSPKGAMPLALQIWSEAQHDPALALLVRRMYGRMLEALKLVVVRAQERGELTSSVDPEAVAMVLASLVQGYGLQRQLTGGPSPETFEAGIRTLMDATRAR